MSAVATTRAPIFPLNTVLFPGGVLPLRIFEPRYLDMVARCLRADQPFVVACISEGRETGPARFHDLGTTARISDFDRLADGMLGITARGEQRVRISAPGVTADGLHEGDITVLPEAPAMALTDADAPLAALLARLLDGLGPPFADLARRPEDGGWVAARLAELLPLELAQKQFLLEVDAPERRLEILRPLVAALSAG